MEQFWESETAISVLCQELVDTKKFDEAYSVIHYTDYAILHNFPELEKKYETLKLIPDSLYDKDYFGPNGFGEPEIPLTSFASLQDFGITSKKVIFYNHEDGSHQITNAFKKLIKKNQVVGFDTESFDKTLKFRMGNMQILQLAVEDTVFIFDIASLKDKDYFRDNLKELFTNGTVTKIAHSFTGDVSEMARTLKINLHRDMCHNFVDTQQEIKRVDGSDISLKDLVFKFFGKHLCKTNTMSNWSQPKLRKAQIHYAALDAYVLLKINEKMDSLKAEGKWEEF